MPAPFARDRAPSQRTEEGDEKVSAAVRHPRAGEFPARTRTKHGRRSNPKVEDVCTRAPSAPSSRAALRVGARRARRGAWNWKAVQDWGNLRASPLPLPLPLTLYLQFSAPSASPNVASEDMLDGWIASVQSQVCNVACARVHIHTVG